MNTRFAVAVHILTYLACRRGESVTSDEVAGSVGTHPALIRRICAQLATAGLVQGQRGAGGGCGLGRPAARIRLVDVYRAVAGEDREMIPLHDTSNPCCRVGERLAGVLAGRVRAAERALERELARTTIRDLVVAVEPARRTRTAPA